jgi:hypothetical protein
LVYFINKNLAALAVQADKKADKANSSFSAYSFELFGLGLRFDRLGCRYGSAAE